MNNFFQSTPKKDGPQSGWPTTNTTQIPFNSTMQNQQPNLNTPFQGSQINLGFPQSQPTGLFGNSIAPPLNTFGSSSFGTNQNTANMPTSNFGATSSSNPFGGNNLQQQTTPYSSFGGSQNLFGGQTQQQSPFVSSSMQTSSPFANSSIQSSSPFSSSNTQTPFSSSQSPAFSNASNTFGSGIQKPLSFPGSFGSSQFNQSQFNSQPMGNQSTGWSTTPSNTWGIQNKGSKIAPFATTRINEDGGVYSDIVSISAMKEFANKTVDEIRIEDYEQSLTPPKQTVKPFISLGSTTNSPFGSTTPSSSFSGFSSTPVNTSPFNTSKPIGLSSPFGTQSNISSTTPGMTTTTPFNSSVSPFGNNSLNSSNQTSPFSTLTNTPVNSSFTQPTASPFSSSTFSSSTFPGSSQQPTSTTSNLFGSQQTQQPSLQTTTQPPLFGSSNSSLPNTRNLFSSQPQSSLFTSPANTFKPTVPVQTGFNTNPFSTQFSSSNQFPSSNPFSTPTPFASQSSLFSSSPSRVDNDPYLLKNVKFEQFEQQKPSIRIPLPSPIFKSRNDSPVVDLKIRPPKPVEKHPLYTIPDLREMKSPQIISNLVVGFEGKGRVEFLDPVSVTAFEDIEKNITFRGDCVEISDPVGSGMNRRARVYIENLFPFCKSSNELIKGQVEKFPQKAVQDRFIYQLKEEKHKKFIDYNVDTGVYVYEVDNF